MEGLIPVFKHTFQVEFVGVSGQGDSPEVFYSVEGLGKSVSAEGLRFAPGGGGSSVRAHSSYATTDLVLRRPIMEKGSKITKWCEDALEKLVYDPVPVYIFVLNSEKDVVAQWTAENSYPVGIEISSMEVGFGSGMIEEKITMRYSNLIRNKPVG